MRCKKFLLITLISATMFASAGFGFYYDFGLEEIPLFWAGYDRDLGNFTTFMNVANLNLRLNLSDYSGIKFRLKDFYLLGQKDWVTNLSWTNKYNQNVLYIDRLSYSYSSDNWGLRAGRDMFVENNGMLIGNQADGLQLNTSFLQMKQHLTVYYSGFYLPQGYDSLSFGPYDTVTTNYDPTSRLFTGFSIEKIGLLLDDISATVLYSMDMTTNKYYNPLFLSAAFKTSVMSGLSFNGTFAYEMGQYITNINISGFAGDAGFIYGMKTPINIAFHGGLAYASGDNTSTSSTYEGFRSFGKYPTTSVYWVDFSNIFIFGIGATLRFFDDYLKISADYHYVLRNQTNDLNFDSAQTGFNGTGSDIGNEIAGSVNFNFDPNFSIFTSGGLFLMGKAFKDPKNIYKIIVGTSIQL